MRCDLHLCPQTGISHILLHYGTVSLWYFLPPASLSEPALLGDLIGRLMGSTVSGKVYTPRALGRGDRPPRRPSSGFGLLTAAMFTIGLARRHAPCRRADHYGRNQVSDSFVTTCAEGSYLGKSEIPDLRRMAQRRNRKLFAMNYGYSRSSSNTKICIIV